MSSSSSISSYPSLNPPQTWTWRGFSICYHYQGEAGIPIVLIHGFGASWRHWRKNIPILSQTFRVYAIDLLGFGASAKPTPGKGSIDYTFETWGAQISDFCQEVVGEPVFLVGNSIGCIAAMQAAVASPNWVQGVVLINCSLRLLHDRRRSQLPWYRNAGSKVLQSLLGIRWLGQSFFRLIAQPKTVRKILLQAYIDSEAVTDELVDLILTPAADPGAADVFLAFTRYSQGPLPEDLLEQITCPVLILWGTDDPWEPIALGRKLAQFPCVQDFIPLEGVGHCPQDEAPEKVSPILQEWITSSAEA